MKKSLRLLSASALIFTAMISKAQVAIYTETFPGTTLPAGWVASPSRGWNVDSSTNAANNAPAPPYSGGWHLIIRNHDPADTSTPQPGTYSVLSRPVDATNYTNISVGWAARRTRNFATTQVLNLEASANGASGPWTPITYTDRPADSQWGDVTPVTLPASFDRAPALTFRYTLTTLTASGTYRIDDFKIEGDLTVSLGSSFKTLVPIWRQQASRIEVEFDAKPNDLSTISVIDLLGRQQMTQQVKGGEVTLDLDHLAKGVYYIHLVQGNKKAIRKIAIH